MFLQCVIVVYCCCRPAAVGGAGGGVDAVRGRGAAHARPLRPAAVPHVLGRRARVHPQLHVQVSCIHTHTRTRHSRT